MMKLLLLKKKEKYLSDIMIFIDLISSSNLEICNHSEVHLQDNPNLLNKNKLYMTNSRGINNTIAILYMNYTLHS